MNITKNSRTLKSTFDSILQGNVFEHQHSLYLKIQSPASGTENAVSISRGVPTRFNEGEAVTSYPEAELVTNQAALEEGN